MSRDPRENQKNPGQKPGKEGQGRPGDRNPQKGHENDPKQGKGSEKGR